MAPHALPRRRFLLPLTLALVLAAEAAGMALGVQVRPDVPGGGQAAIPDLTAAARWTTTVLTTVGRAFADARTPPPANPRVGRATLARPVGNAAVQPRFRATPSRAATPRPAIFAPAGATITTAGTARATSSAAYRGRNHVWIPSLGINRSVSPFSCSRTRPPDNLVYRWGCAGANNVYLLGHAHSVFKPLHDAYARGRLAKGMKAVYADASGRVKTYAVVWWKVTPPTSEAAWAWAAQTRPSMTLQTCVGPTSDLRLVVRLVAID